MIRHIVLLRARPTTTQDQIDAVFADIGRLRELMPGIEQFMSGPSLQLEQMEHGFLHGFVVDFVDRAALDAYQAHPAHRLAGDRLVGLADGGRDGLLVFDMVFDS